MWELLTSDYRSLVQDVLACTICLAALVWGGGPERIIAATWFILFEVATWIHGAVMGSGNQLVEVDWFLASTDVLAGAIWIAVALYANRNYPLWIAGMQVLAITAHIARGLSDIISPIAYVTMVVAPGWFQLIFLAAGLIRHIKRKRRYGKYRDWRIVSGQGPDTREARRVIPGLISSGHANWRDELK